MQPGSERNADPEVEVQKRLYSDLVEVMNSKNDRTYNLLPEGM